MAKSINQLSDEMVWEAHERMNQKLEAAPGAELKQPQVSLAMYSPLVSKRDLLSYHNNAMC